MSQHNLQFNLEKLEKEVMDKANFYYICKYHGEKHLKDCIREALYAITKLTEVQFCNLFGVFSKDLIKQPFDYEQYVEDVYNKMKDLGAI